MLARLKGDEIGIRVQLKFRHLGHRDLSNFLEKWENNNGFGKVKCGGCFCFFI